MAPTGRAWRNAKYSTMRFQRDMFEHRGPIMLFGEHHFVLVGWATAVQLYVEVPVNDR